MSQKMLKSTDNNSLRVIEMQLEECEQANRLIYEKKLNNAKKQINETMAEFQDKIESMEKERNLRLKLLQDKRKDLDKVSAEVPDI